MINQVSGAFHSPEQLHTAGRNQSENSSLDGLSLGKGLSAKEQQEIEAISLLKKPLPVKGWIDGKANNQRVSLTFDRRQWTIDGTANNSDVKLAIDHDNGTITGDANGKNMVIDFDWSPRGIAMEDKDNALKVAMDWEKGTLKGKIYGKPLDIKFDMKKGTIKDVSARKAIDVKYDKVSGELKGSINNEEAQMTMVNLDMYDFLTHLYLFTS